MRKDRILIGVLLLSSALLMPTSWADGIPNFTPTPQTDPDFVKGKQAVDAKNWSVAIQALNAAARRDTRNADVENYLGYAYRNSGQLPEAFKHYERALTLDPRHRGAHEYVGEAYLLNGQPDKAEMHLARLKELCPQSCEEYVDLKEHVDAYRRKHPR